MITRLSHIAVAAIVALHATEHCSRCGDGESAAGASMDGSAPATSATGGGRTGSCDRVTGMSLCSEYTGAYLAQNEAVLSSSCGKLGGAFVAAECPNTSVLGSCVLSTGEVRKFYASGGASYDAARAQAECEGPYRGKWTAFH